MPGTGKKKRHTSAISALLERSSRGTKILEADRSESGGGGKVKGVLVVRGKGRGDEKGEVKLLGGLWGSFLMGERVEFS